MPRKNLGFEFFADLVVSDSQLKAHFNGCHLIFRRVIIQIHGRNSQAEWWYVLQQSVVRAVDIDENGDVLGVYDVWEVETDGTLKVIDQVLPDA